MKKKFLILFFSIAALMHFDSIKPMDPTEPSNNKLSTEDPCLKPPTTVKTNIKQVPTDCLLIILEYFSNNKPKRLFPVALVNKEFKELVSEIPVSFTLCPKNIEEFFAHDCLFKNITHLTIEDVYCKKQQIPSGKKPIQNVKKLTLKNCSTYELLSKYFLENVTELHLDTPKQGLNMNQQPKKNFKKLQTLSLHKVTHFQLAPFNFGHLKKVSLSNYHGDRGGSLLLEKLNLKSLKKLTLLFNRGGGGLEFSGTNMIERLKKAGCNVVIFGLDPFNFGYLKKVKCLSSYHGDRDSLILEKLNLKSLKKLTVFNCGNLKISGTDMIERLKKTGLIDYS